MIPVLYSNGSGGNYQDGFGLGMLPDCESCHVVEERNGTYYLEMTYPVGGVNWERFQTGYLIKAVPSDGGDEQLFRINSVRQLLTGRLEITAEHVSAHAQYVIVSPLSGSYNCAGFISALPSHIVQVGYGSGYDPLGGLTLSAAGSSDTVRVNYSTPRTLRDALMGAQGAATDIWGVEYEYRNYGFNIVARTQNSPRGKTLTEGITYGVNMTNLDIERMVGGNYNCVFGYYYDEQTGTYVDSGSAPYCTQYQAMDKFPPRSIAVDFSGDYSDSVPTSRQLYDKANTYANANGSQGPDFTAKVQFAPTWQSLDYATIADGARINLCDTVPITYEKYGITLTAKVIKTDFDVLTERYRSIEVGTAKKNLGKLLAQTAKSAGVSVYR